MKLIYKYYIAPVNIAPQEVTVHFSNFVIDILDIQEQGDAFWVWALVDTELPQEETQIFSIAWTGRPIETNLKPRAAFYKYMKTIQASNGLVYHFFLAV